MMLNLDGLPHWHFTCCGPPWPGPARHTTACHPSCPPPLPAQTALPESCSYLRKDFGSSPIFDYQAGWTSNETIPSYCMLE